MPEIQYVEANGLKFAYLEEGTGPLVLLLHGFPDTARTWDDLRPRLAAKGFRAVSPFLRGYSPTAVPEQDADTRILAEDARELIGALGEESAVVVGHDWGATAAYGAAALAPERIKLLVTVAIPHPATLRATPRKVWGVRHFFAYKLPGAAGRFAADNFAALPKICKRWSPTWSPSHEELQPARECFSAPGSLEAAMGYYRSFSPRQAPHLQRKIEVSTVVFSGHDDPIAGRDDYERAAHMFTRGYVIEQMPGGHFMHREHPEVFAEKLLKHLP